MALALCLGGGCPSADLGRQILEQAGTLVNVSVHDLQDFDSEFNAKADLAMSEAEKNKDAFKEKAAAN